MCSVLDETSRLGAVGPDPGPVLKDPKDGFDVIQHKLVRDRTLPPHRHSAISRRQK